MSHSFIYRESPVRSTLLEESVLSSFGVKVVSWDQCASTLGFRFGWREFPDEGPGDFIGLAVVIMDDKVAMKFFIDFNLNRKSFC